MEVKVDAFLSFSEFEKPNEERLRHTENKPLEIR